MIYFITGFNFIIGLTCIIRVSHLLDALKVTANFAEKITDLASQNTDDINKLKALLQVKDENTDKPRAT